MAFEFLKNLFGKNEDGTPKAMTADEMEAAITAANMNVIDLAAGTHIPKSDFDAKVLELEGVKGQLDEANTAIKSYKDMDIDGIKQSAADWENKYNTDTAELQRKLEEQAYEFAVKEYMGAFQFTSDLAKDAATSQFLSQKFKRGDDGRFLGADDFMKQMKKNNPAAFVSDNPKPSFAPPKEGEPPKRGNKMSLTEKMKYANEHPGTDVSTLFE